MVKCQTMNCNQPHQIVIVGGGFFGGLYAAQSLRGSDVEATLIDRRNFHLFQPLLYQVATGGLSPGYIASPLRAVLSRQRNVRVLQGEVTGFEVENRQVLLGEERIRYDTLIVAAGSSHHYFGNDQWECLAPGLKTIEDALHTRQRVFQAFEQAEREGDPDIRKQLMTFVVVGGGPTGSSCWCDRRACAAHAEKRFSFDRYRVRVRAAAGRHRSASANVPARALGVGERFPEKAWVLPYAKTRS